MSTYITGDGDDVVVASDRDDLIKTNGGNDTITARRGDDVICAGDGDDVVDAGDGSDAVYAGDGWDQVSGGNGNDTIRGGTGNDRLSGGNGNDSIDGGGDDDFIDGGNGDDRLFGGGGYGDWIVTGNGSDLAHGGSGHDYIDASMGSGGDRLYGDGYESLDDFLAGNPVTTDFGSDTLIAGGGNDILYGDSGLDGAAGGDDALVGGAGNDKLYGEGGNDWLDGGEGNDKLRGGYGDDTLIGGLGADVLSGGAGSDRFLLWSEPSESPLLAPDRITDFVSGEDRIDIAPVLDTGKFAWGGTTPTARGAWYAHMFGQTHVFASVNDDAFPEIRIVLDGIHNLTPTDFWGVVGDNGPPLLQDDGAVLAEDAIYEATFNVFSNDLGEADLHVTGVSFGATAGTLGVPLQGQYGSLVLDASGVYTYTLDNFSAAVQGLGNGEVAQDVFTYTAADAGGSSGASLTLFIVGSNDVPTAANASFVTIEDMSVAGTLPAATDLDGDAVAYGLVFQAANGTAVVDSSGSFIYTPNANFSGTDSFVFNVSDGISANAYTVDVTVTADNDAPLVANYGVPAGIVKTPIGSGASNDLAGGMVLQPDGKIVLAGQSSSPAGLQDFSIARYNADGTFDTTFGNGGIAITPASSGISPEAGTSVALQPDGKVLVAGWSILPSGVDFMVVRYNANGSLDTTFGGGDGIVTTAVGATNATDQALHLAVQGDGKIVVVGSTQPGFVPPGLPGPGGDIALVRYNADGSLDATFGVGGVVISPLAPAGGPDSARAVLSQPDGGVLVAGSVFFSTTGDDFALVRYTSSGVLDTTFGGGDGIVTTAVVPFADSARSILQQPDGRIVIAGTASQIPGSDFALARYNSDGSLDTSFGTGGIVTTNIVGIGSGTDSGTSVALQADGKLLVGGFTTANLGNDFAIVRYNANGTVDTTFGSGGVVITNIAATLLSGGALQLTEDTAIGIAVQADGKIVLGGHSATVGPTGQADFALVRYNADGTLDATFRAEERLIANEGAAFSHTVPADRFADPDGDALTLTAKQSDGGDLPAWLTFDAVTRTLSGTAPAGSADVHVRVTATDAGGLSASYAYWVYTNAPPAAAGPSGIVTTSLTTSTANFADQANAVVLQPDGKYLVTGFGGGPGGSDTVVARYNADGSLDLLFGGGDGIATININTNPGGTDTGRGIVALPDGRILVAGTATTPTGGTDIALSRLNADGTLDSSFGGGDGILTTPIAAGAGNDAGNSIVLQADGKIIVAGTTNVGSISEIAVVRYNADGTLDTTFDADGFAIAGVSPAADEGLSVKTQLDGKIVVSGYASIAGDPAFLVARFNTDGSRDNTFGTNGIVTTNVGLGFSPFPETAQSVAIQPDGRIVAVGWAPTPTSPLDIAIVRYTSTGALDTTFGAGGIVRTAPGTALDFAFGVAIQPDGRIVVAAGTFNPTGGPDIAVLRYNPDGSLDTTFGGGDGIVTTAIGPGGTPDAALSLVLQADGRIVIAGYGTPPTGGSTDFALVRYNADGSLDATFGGLGNPTVEIGKAFSWVLPAQVVTDADNDTLTYAITMTDGSALPAWLTFNGTTRALIGTPPPGTTDLALRVMATDPWGAAASRDFVINVENPNDAPFVANYGVPAGVVHTPIASGQTADSANGMVIQPDGKILLAGISSPLSTGQDFSLARYNADGSFDTTFGNGGIVITPVSFGTTADTGTSVALQPDGKVLVAGFTVTGNGLDFALLRYNANGTLDTSFGGGDGIVTTPVGAGIAQDQALHLAVQSGGKIVVVGSSLSGPPGPSQQDIAIVRYNADGSLDATFGAGGRIITAISPTSADAGQAVLSQPDGGIVVAGFTTTTATGQDFALVRYTAAGVLDLSFGGGDGIVVTAVGPINDSARAILQQPDGRIVIAGVGSPGVPVPSSFALARYNPDGSPDTTFGTGGVVITQIGAGASSGTSVAQQADGKLLVAGSTNGVPGDFAIVRYNQNGTVDTTFGVNGIVVTGAGPGTNPDTAWAISVQADGKIVVAGNGLLAASSFDFVVARYNPDGSLDGTFRAEERLVATEGTVFSHTVPANRFADPDGDALTYSAAQSDGSALPGWLNFDAATRTFSGVAPPNSADAHVRVRATDPDGLSASYAYWIYTNSAPTSGGSGFVTTNVPSPLIVQDQVSGIALQADGKIVAVGITTGPSPTLTDIAVARYTADGSLDLSFGGGDGIVTINTNPGPGTETGRGVVVQPDGRIVVVGTTTANGTDIVLSRLNTDGTLDTSFGGGDGIVITPVAAGVGADTGNAVTLQADGKILVSGMSNGELTLVRYLSDGSLDATFDLDGIAFAGASPTNDEGLSVKTQPDGKIVVAGYTALGAGSAFLVARFNADGSRDSGFGTNGIVATDITAGPTPIPPFQEAGQALAILADGRILVVGQAPTATSPSDIALVRYLSNGSLDTSFGTGGIVTTAAGTAQELGFGVALDSAGRIVVAGGNFTPTGGPNIAVLRYNADGTLDTTFGGTGIVTTTIAAGLGGETALSVTIQPDGRIVIGGSSQSPAPITTAPISSDFTLVRYNTDGSLDTTFGGIGSPTVEVGKSFAWTIPPRAFADADADALTYTITLADGTPLPSWLTFNGTTLAGTPPPGAADLALRVTATDPWGAAAQQTLVLNVDDGNEAPFVASPGTPPGVVHTPIGSGTSQDLAGGVAVQPDGKIVMAGQSSSPLTNQDFAVVRYNADGSLDTTFGGDGIVINAIGGLSTDIASSVALQPDGKVLVAGMSPGPGTSFDFTLVRYNADGSFDTTFGGGDGVAMAALGPGLARDEALSLAVQADGRIVVVGTFQNTAAFPPVGFGDIGVVRFTADGVLDATFGGGDGIVTTSIGLDTAADTAAAVVIQPDGSIVVAGTTTLAATGQDFVLARYTAAGVLDPSFGGGDGIVTTAVAPASGADTARAILLQPDGRIVVAGQAGSSDFALARYNADGTLDATFGTGGIVITPLLGFEAATGVALLPDGKLLVGGWTSSGPTSSFAVVRYNANGTVDTTFGAGGVVYADVPGSTGETAIGIVLQADGKFVLGGHAGTATGSDFALARFNADGSLDPTFRAEERVAATEGASFTYTVPPGRFADPDGDALTYTATQSDGDALPVWLEFDAATLTLSGTAPTGSGDVHVRVTATDPAGLSASYAYWIYTNAAPTALGPSGFTTVNLGPVGPVPDFASAVAVQADGKILLTGSSLGASDTPLVRLNTDGSLDLTFATSGILRINTNPAPAVENGRAIGVQPDGRIVVAGTSGADLSVIRIFPDGALDGSFGGGDGIVVTNIPGGVTDVASAVTLQADGKILVAGRTTVGAENQLLLVRYNVDGALDATFDADGIFVAPVATNADEGFSVKTQADGKIVVSGYSAVGPLEHSLLVARFNTNGSLDTSFGGTGIVTTDIGLGTGLPSGSVVPGVVFEAGQSLQILSDGRILVAGYGPTPTGGTDIALVRYLSDGSLDTSFGGDGVVTTAVSAGAIVDRALGVALQADGRIVVAGAAVTTDGGGDIAVLRYLADGSLDPSFGGDGVVTVAVSPAQLPDQAIGVAILPDGRIVVGGTAGIGSQTDYAAVVLNPDGSLDTTFGGIGSPVVNAGESFSWSVQRFFIDADNDALTYSLTMADGSALPAWATFNGTALNGIAPLGAPDLALRLTATDPGGASATQDFVLRVESPNAAPIVNYAVPAGIVLSPIGPGNSADLATGMVVQPNGKIVVVGQSSTPETSQDFTVVRYNTDGSFDTTFGGDGIVVTPGGSGGTSDIANSVALQADGKILVAGIGGSDFALARYNIDGSLDATFGGGDGIVTTAVGPAFSRDDALSVTVQSDGKIVVVGSAQNSTAFPPPGPPQTADIAVVRYNSDGSLDTTFGGGDGVLTTEIGAGVLADAAHDVLVQPDGGIVVAGYTALTGLPNMVTDFALVRYTASGALDTTFGGGDGIVTTAIGPAGPTGNADQARSILQQPDGRIVVVGYSGPAIGASDFVLARYNTDGSLDATFGTDGVLVHSISVGGLEQATGVVRQPDGKLLVTGRGASDFVIARYNENGTVDTTFGTNGAITTNVGAGGIAVGIALQADGKIVVNGHASSAINGGLDFALVRYNADGSLDATFRGEERVAATEDRPFAYTIPADRFVDPDGDVLTFSAAQTNGSALPSWLDFDAATRTFSGTAPAGSGDVHVRVTATDPAGLSASNAYWIYTNTAPNVVGPSGIVSINLTNAVGFSGSDVATAVALQGDGKILLTGSTSAIGDTPVVRLNADGSLDLGFSVDGILTINTITGGIDTGRSIIAQPDGRILIASNSGSDIAVTRVFADGFALDGSFGGGDGIATTNIPGGTVDTGQSITLQADGKIVVTGRTTVGTENQLIVVRHNTDGTLDSTFDGDGIAIVPVAMNVDEGFSVKTQADGKIVVSGYGATSAIEHSIVVARFNTDGSLDTGFAGDGIATTDIGVGPGTIPILPNFTFSEAGQGLAIQTDGRIVVAGYGPTASGGTDIALVRYNTDGSLDATFGTGGVVTTAVSAGTAVDRAFGVALQSDGRIVVVGGVVTTEGGGDIAVLRYLSDGSLDAAFGSDGIVTVAIGPGQQAEIPTYVAIQPDGRILVGGSTQFALNGSTSMDFAAVRLNPDGSLDTTFGGIGSPVVNAGQQFSWTVQRFIADADTDVLTYTMTMADGSPLAAGLTFTGAPPNGAGAALSGTVASGTGDLALRLTATDPYGAEASQYFVLHVNDPLAPLDDGDTFAFDDGFGEATVTGFTAGDASGDVLDLSGLTNPEWTSFADILARTTDGDAGALIDLGDGNTITLIGVTKSSLTADDFDL